MPSARKAHRAEGSGGRAPQKAGKAVDPARVEEALRKVEERLEAMEARLSSLERKLGPVVETDIGPPCCSDDIVGCLDDCEVDVKELRKKVRNVRSPPRGH